MAGIFISYRREDSIAYAGWMHDRLLKEFPRQQLFMDLATLEPGENFVGAIEDSVHRCKVFLAVIGKRWLHAKDSRGIRRLENPDDWVRIEIEIALERKIPVIPCLVGGMTMAKLVGLPKSLAPLTHRHALTLSDQRFHRDVDILIETIKKAIGTPKRISPSNKKRKETKGNTSDLLRVTGNMVRIPQGAFLYGAQPKKCTIEYDFYIDKNLVTNQEYAKFMNAGGYDDQSLWSEQGWKWRKTGDIAQPAYWKYAKWSQPTHPVVGVSYYEAEAYAQWAEKRLPTEMEWEKAARSTDGRLFPWGDQFDPKKCTSKESGSRGTTSIQTYPKGVSPLGCYDMAGNVWEWCASWWRKGMAFRVLHGGSWEDEARCLRANYLNKSWPTGREKNIGFRCARE